ncbi:LOW QUALITY PROTEIN: PPR_1 domain-containing protein/PPR_2 domain-containing protein, partial [Cephalotus follicularis]
GLEPTSVTFNTLMDGLLMRLVALKMMRLCDKMAKTGFKPDVFTCNTIVNLLCYMGNTKIAVNFLEKTDQGGVEPDLITYNAIPSFARTSSDAFNLLSEMKNKGILPDHVNCICSTQCAYNLGQWKEATRVMNGLVTYNSMIAKLCEDKLITDALNLFSEMKNKGILPDRATCICLIQCAYNLGQCKESRRLLNEMVDMIPAAALFPLFVDALLNKRSASYAQAVFDTMIQRGEQPDISTYHMLMEGYCLQSQMDTATYCSAKNVFKEFSATSQSTIDMVTFSPMLDGLCNHGYLEEALDLLQEMDDDEFVPNILCYNIIFDCMCNSGLIESIGQARIQLEMFSGIPAKGLHPNVITCNIFISGLCKEGLSNEAYGGFFQKMEDHGCLPDSYSYNTIIKGFLRNNYASKAMHLLDEMLSKDFPQ